MIALGQTPDGHTYKGSKFHRVIENFMIQGGDIINGDGTGSYTVWDGKGGKFADENLNAAKLEPGVLAMANSGPNTNGCQFFITTAPTPWLNGKHQVFGRVLEGMELVDAISHIEVDANDRPTLPVIIKDAGEVPLTR
jgi:cyclophilin family peptidyl-prolyl cis-trans isomerase